MRGSIILLLALAGCAKSSAIPLSNDTIQLTTGAAPVCGQVGAQAVAGKQAAIETIRRGYDRFAISGGQYTNDVQVIGYTPVQANTVTTGSVHAYGNSAYGSARSNTMVTGGEPIIGGTHNQGLIVKMFKADDPAGSNAVDARASLGPDWAKYVESGVNTCM